MRMTAPAIAAGTRRLKTTERRQQGPDSLLFQCFQPGQDAFLHPGNGFELRDGDCLRDCQFIDFSLLVGQNLVEAAYAQDGRADNADPITI